MERIRTHFTSLHSLHSLHALLRSGPNPAPWWWNDAAGLKGCRARPNTPVFFTTPRSRQIERPRRRRPFSVEATPPSSLAARRATHTTRLDQNADSPRFDFCHRRRAPSSRDSPRTLAPYGLAPRRPEAIPSAKPSARPSCIPRYHITHTPIPHADRGARLVMPARRRVIACVIALSHVTPRDVE